jgi:hypothetical protein
MTTMKTAAMNAAKAMSSATVPRRSFMSRIKKKCELLSMRHYESGLHDLEEG